MPLAALLFAPPVGPIVHRAAKKLFVANSGLVGLSVAVLKDGRTTFYNFGTVEKGKARRPTPHTLFRIASVTKTFTSTLLAQAAIEHKVRLEDDVRKYLKGSYPNLEFEGKPIQLRYLTNHRSGLPFILPDKPEAMPDFAGSDLSWSGRMVKLWKGYSQADFYRDLANVKLTWTPNSRSSYSNTAVQVLGDVLSTVYGAPFESLVKSKIAKPLGMSDTCISPTGAQAKRLAVGYDAHGRAAVPLPDRVGGAGALKSTAFDLAKYVRWEMAERDPAVRLTHRPVFTVGDYSAGLNWQMMRRNGRRVIWQSGSFPGFQTLLVMQPELHCGFVLLSNGDDVPTAGKCLEDMANEMLMAMDKRSIALP